ncbi:MAG TPA: Mur ligase domain-containing protein, partial [Ornithinibacter sp.]|nr:Mur ligase domain-containing protein [Ornithinibacter sp.]
MIALSLPEVAQVTGGSVVVPPGVDPAAVVVDGPVVTDSRESGPGGLFVARNGEHADGHDFVAGAVDRGAVAALVTRPVEGVPCVVVADTQDAFAALAREVVRRLPAMDVVGITGSSGKTSTKDLLGTVLATAGPTVAPVGSYNSEVGVPLTVCRVTADTRFLVV